MTAPTAPALEIDRILKDPKTNLVVCCGAGGVGKTTTAAALALRAAEHGRKVVVLTIDPARRLAQALGVENLDNDPQPVKLGPEVKGEMQAMMLNMKRTFDDMVIEHAPDKAEAIFANPVYQTAASSFGGTQEYMAMEKLGQLSDQGLWPIHSALVGKGLEFTTGIFRISAARSWSVAWGRAEDKFAVPHSQCDRVEER